MCINWQLEALAATGHCFSAALAKWHLCARKCEAVCDSSENRQPTLADLSELQLQHVITCPSVSNLAKSPDLKQQNAQ